ncbi:hypothetical protein AK812_SmicGene23357 [Symbiodinium microadriaticum]|uniref:Uncharacterized protein n=1 Tax=Symbiodinium microadriaticum TaxID=2951 RepID=A0A1Q9DHF0_SYMMI|nr:hypothetical protein AK812_SmicGene23357 [Symbiodinium microadriaticum]
MLGYRPYRCCGYPAFRTGPTRLALEDILATEARRFEELFVSVSKRPASTPEANIPAFRLLKLVLEVKHEACVAALRARVLTGEALLQVMEQKG